MVMVGMLWSDFLTSQYVVEGMHMCLCVGGGGWGGEGVKELALVDVRFSQTNVFLKFL